MFACLVDDPKLQSKKAQFKLDIADGDADCAADELEMSFIEELDWDEDAFKNDYSSTRFYKLSETLKLIEIKFGAILVALGKRPRDFNALFKLSPKQKLMYFFKAFLSSTRDGRKPDPTAGIEDFATASISPELAFGELENDELGTMQICGGEVESEKIAKRIAMFYALKDHCAYI